VTQTPVLVTRPEPGASATARRLRAMGFAPYVAPLLAITPIPARLPPADRLGAIVIASQHAVAPLPPSHHALPLFAVGEATAEMARLHGFSQVSSADGDAVALAALVAREMVPGGLPLLLVAGRGQGHDLSRRLGEDGFAVDLVHVYAARAVETLPAAAHAMIGANRGGRVLLFSRETAFCFRRLIEETNLLAGFSTLDLAAISRPVAEAAGGLPWRSIRVAMTPTETAVLALLHD
jgi:uroporphyrinogen-III synthase